jgi:F-type H+-transporting ATPase subunit c
MKLPKVKRKALRKVLVFIMMFAIMFTLSAITVSASSGSGTSGTDAKGFVLGMSALAAGICTLSGLGSGLGQGMAAAKVAEAVARQPEAKGAILTNTLVTCAVAETCSIYGFVIALILVLANPLVGML